MTAAWLLNRRLNDEVAGARPVVAVDPGDVTGVAILDGLRSVYALELPLDRAMVAVRDTLVTLSTGEPPEITCEAFVITDETTKKSQQPSAIKGIGVVEFLAARHGIQVHIQTAAEAKKFVTDARLKHLGWHCPTPGGHVNDALRHLYLRLVKTGRYLPPEGVV